MHRKTAGDRGSIGPMQSPLDALLEYYAVFSTTDLGAISAWFTEPCMSMGPQGVFAAANREDVVAAFGAFVERLREKGYVKSEFIDSRITMLTDFAAVAAGTAVRYAAGGVEIERAPVSYLMHRTEAGWKIAVIVLQR